MSNFRNVYTGVDLDSIFAGRVTAPTSAVGFRNNDGQDLSMRYEKANAAPATAAVGYRGPDGRDLSQWSSTSATGNLSVSVSSDSSSFDNGLSNTPAMRPMTVGASAVAGGGTGSYTYTWSIVQVTGGVDQATLSSTNGSNIQLSVRAYINRPGSVRLRCTVTDGVGSTYGESVSNFDYYSQV